MSENFISCEKYRNGSPRVTFDGKYTCASVKAPIGTGPYRVVQKLVTNSVTDISRAVPASEFTQYCFTNTGCTYFANEYVAEIHFAKVPDHRLAPVYDNIIMRAYESQENIKDSLLDGTLDIAYGLTSLSASAFIRLATDEGGSLVAHQAPFNLNTRRIVLNSDGRLDTKSKRQLIFGLIDREPLVNGELSEEDSAQTLFDPDYPYCHIPLLSVEEVAALNTDTTAADIAANGPLRLAYQTDATHQNIIASKIIADLVTAGIQVQPMPMTKDNYNAAMDSWLSGDSSWDIAYSETWGPSYDAGTKLYDMTYDDGSGEADSAATSNLEGISRVDFSSLVRSLSTIIDDDERQAGYTEILELLNEEAIFLPLTHKRNIAVTNTRVSGFQFGSTEFDFPLAQLYPTPPPSKDDGLTDSELAGVIAGSVGGGILIIFIAVLIAREVQGKPIFYTIISQQSSTEMAVRA
jgi:ABC-type transport system substrate-binding protein